MLRIITRRLILALILIAFAVLFVAYFQHNQTSVPPAEYSRAVSTGLLPDPSLTPGDPDPTITVQTVCTQSTKERRDVLPSTRRAVFASYGMPNDHSLWCNTPAKCEMDHLCSLELGCTNSPKNLWPQPFVGEWNAHMKDKLENRLHLLMCRGDLTMPEAQHAIITNWINAYKCMEAADEAACMKQVVR